MQGRNPQRLGVPELSNGTSRTSPHFYCELNKVIQTPPWNEEVRRGGGGGRGGGGIHYLHRHGILHGVRQRCRSNPVGWVTVRLCHNHRRFFFRDNQTYCCCALWLTCDGYRIHGGICLPCSEEYGSDWRRFCACRRCGACERKG